MSSQADYLASLESFGSLGTGTYGQSSPRFNYANPYSGMAQWGPGGVPMMPPVNAMAQVPAVAAPVPFEDGFIPSMVSGGFGTPAAAAGGGGIFGGLFDGLGQKMQDWGVTARYNPVTGLKEADGFGGLALGAASGIASAFMGMKQYGIAKDTLNENKRQFQMNYDAQKQGVNTQLEDRQRARVAANSGAYESVGSYMDRNKVK